LLVDENRRVLSLASRFVRVIREDLELLLNASLRRSRFLVAYDGGFVPFAFSIGDAGQRVWSLQPEIAQENSTAEIAEWLRSKLQTTARLQGFRACVLVGDAQVKGDQGPEDAIVIEMHHRDRSPLVAYLRYQQPGRGEACIFGQLGYGRSLKRVFDDPGWAASEAAEDRNDPASQDRQVLDMLAEQGVDLSRPLTIVNYLFFPDERASRGAGRIIEQALFEASILRPNEYSSDPEWTIEAAQERLLSDESLTRMRDLFTAVAEGFGGEYDGWEAAAYDEESESS
jgi:hypothetical protein